MPNKNGYADRLHAVMTSGGFRLSISRAMKQAAIVGTASLLPLCGCISNVPLPKLPKLASTPGDGALVTLTSPVPIALTAKDLRSVAWIGDSYAIQGNITNPLASSLKARFGDGGVGWIDLYYLGSIDPGVVIRATAGWVPQRNTPTSTGLNLSDIRTTDVAVPSRITVQVNAQKMTLFYYARPGGGTFEWWVDGAPKITVRTASSIPALKSSTISNLSSGSHLFQIRIVSAGTAGILLDGLDARSGTPGVVVHNPGSAGSTTAAWASVNAQLWEAQLAALHPTLVTIMLTPNDQSVLTTVSGQYSNLFTLVNRIRAAVPGVPIILIPSPDNGLHRAPAMAAYNTSQHALAASLSLGYIDVLDPLNPFNPAWFNADLVHPNATGGGLIANLILTGFKI